MPKKIRASSRIVVNLLKAGFSCVLFAFIISKVNSQELISIVARLSPFSMFVATLLIAISLLFGALRWKVLLKSQGHTLTGGFLCRIVFVGFFFNQWLPSSIGGDIYRVSALGRQINSFAHAFMSVLLERIYGLLTLTLVALGALLLQYSRFGQSTLWLACLLALLGLSLCVIFLVTLRFLPLRWRQKIENKQYLHFIKKFIDVLEITDMSPIYVSQTLLWTCLSHVVFVACFVWIAQELDIPFGWTEAFTVVPIATIISSLPVSFAGWGMREGTFVYTLSYFAISAEAALSLSFIYGVAQLLVAGVGLVLLLVGKKHNKTIANPVSA